MQLKLIEKVTFFYDFVISLRRKSYFPSLSDFVNVMSVVFSFRISIGKIKETLNVRDGIASKC